jgi:hypothetical protein
VGDLVHIDGTRIFQSPADRAAEREVADLLAWRWNCEIIHFGALATIGWFAQRDGRVVALIELKFRDHDPNRFETVYLAWRKWEGLTRGGMALAALPLFVVKFNDGVRWVNCWSVDPRIHIIGGPKRRTVESEREPLILVPVTDMRTVTPP